MMKLAVVLLFTATTVFAFNSKLKNYEGPCKAFGEYMESESEKCKAEIHSGDFTIPEECSKEIQDQVHEIIETLNKKFSGAELTEDAVVEHAKVQFCVVSKLGLIKDNKFDYDGFEKMIKEGSHFQEEKVLESILAAVESAKTHENNGKGWKEFIETDVIDQVLSACEIKPEHYETAVKV